MITDEERNDPEFQEAGASVDLMIEIIRSNKILQMDPNKAFWFMATLSAMVIRALLKDQKNLKQAVDLYVEHIMKSPDVVPKELTGVASKTH